MLDTYPDKNEKVRWAKTPVNNEKARWKETLVKNEKVRWTTDLLLTNPNKRLIFLINV